MKKRKLGKSNLEVSASWAAWELALATVQRAKSGR
jgi:hypothetical protein